MKNSLNPEHFFSLEGFEHKALFEKGSLVWEALVKLPTYLKDQKLGLIEIEIPDGVHLVDRSMISIGKGTVIEPGAFIQGPCVIGRDCQIRQGAYIRGNVVIGDGCVVGHDTEVKHSILLNGAHASHFNYVGDSILGSGVNLGAGAKCANFRLDRAAVSVVVGNERIATGMRKLGAIIGDGAQLGCNCVTDPGTLLGRNVVCYPCLHVHGYIPEGKRVKPAHKNIVE